MGRQSTQRALYLSFNSTVLSVLVLECKIRQAIIMMHE